MIEGYEVLNVFRPARCEYTWLVVDPMVKRDWMDHPKCPPEGCDVLIQNHIRYGWSESNVRYEALGPAR